MAFGRQLHQAKCEFRTVGQASANFAQQPKQVRISHHQPCKCEFRTTSHASANFAPAHVSLVSSNLCMPYWIWDQEGRLVRIENPQDTELDICVNIIDPP
uniref:Uncharacterized protein n=1 Tax=Vitis vinifera TaxID=29760 RepID=A5BM15_VITVI|nr:hypothetical protein VITISV_012387 [Vitis vinifera]